MDRFVIPSIVANCLTESAAIGDEASPFRGKAYGGDPRLVLIVGPNASGKSLLFRMIAQWLQRDHKATPVTISIRERTGSGEMEMAGMRRMMMFGDETTQSTGAASARVVEAGFGNANRYPKAALLLDEPELGLSDGYARALGELIGQMAKDVTETNVGTVVVTHNRELAKGLHVGLGAMPTFVCMEEPLAFQAWLSAREHRTIDDLKALPDLSHRRFRAVHGILQAAKDDKS